MSIPDEHSPIPPNVDRKLIRKFREQIHALGGLWIFVGTLNIKFVSDRHYNGES